MFTTELETAPAAGQISSSEHWAHLQPGIQVFGTQTAGAVQLVQESSGERQIDLYTIFSLTGLHLCMEY